MQSGIVISPQVTDLLGGPTAVDGLDQAPRIDRVVDREPSAGAAPA